MTLTTFAKLLEFLLPKIENLHYQANEMNSPIRLALYFSCVIGVVPMFLYLTWRIARIEITKRRVISGLIVMIFMVTSIIIRQQLIQSTFKGLTHVKTQTGESINMSFAIENLHFEYYLMGGLILGCIVSAFTLRKQKNLK